MCYFEYVMSLGSMSPVWWWRRCGEQVPSHRRVLEILYLPPLAMLTIADVHTLSTPSSRCPCDVCTHPPPKRGRCCRYLAKNNSAATGGAGGKNMVAAIWLGCDQENRALRDLKEEGKPENKIEAVAIEALSAINVVWWFTLGFKEVEAACRPKLQTHNPDGKTMEKLAGCTKAEPSTVEALVAEWSAASANPNAVAGSVDSMPKRKLEDAQSPADSSGSSIDVVEKPNKHKRGKQGPTKNVPATVPLQTYAGPNKKCIKLLFWNLAMRDRAPGTGRNFTPEAIAAVLDVTGNGNTRVGWVGHASRNVGLNDGADKER